MPFDGMPYADQAKAFGFVPMNHHQPKYFEVGKIDVFDDKGHVIPGYAAVRRMDTGDTLAIHSDSYCPIQDRDVFSAFENGMDRAGFDVKDMAVHMDRSHNGARMFVQYVLPSVTEQINGTAVSLRFLMWNSHDGSRKASGRAGFYNWVCANQAVRGKDLDTFEVRHIGDASDISVRIDNLVQGADTAVKELRQMRRWAEREITDGTALETFKALPGTSKALVGDLMVDWTQAKTSLGPNGGSTLWALYNVLTAWATHTEGRSKNSANARVERQERVAKLLAAPAWADLAA